MGANNWDTTNKYDEAQISEALNYEASETTLEVTTTPIEAKVGASRVEDRKAIVLMALDNGVTFGFSSGTQAFKLFKNQLIILPVGAGLGLWLKSDAGTKSVVIAEAV